ncbi:GapA-binding peptide SR1P [Pseudogracilibacillus sp. SE30717A]
MGIIICQQCQEVINYYEEEKVTKLYSTCPNCNTKNEKTE